MKQDTKQTWKTNFCNHCNMDIVGKKKILVKQCEESIRCEICDEILRITHFDFPRPIVVKESFKENVFHRKEGESLYPNLTDKDRMIIHKANKLYKETGEFPFTVKDHFNFHHGLLTHGPAFEVLQALENARPRLPENLPFEMPPDYDFTKDEDVDRYLKNGEKDTASLRQYLEEQLGELDKRKHRMVI